MKSNEIELLIEDIKVNEGFRGMPYDDHLGNPTIGYGTLLPLTEKESELLLVHRFDNKKRDLANRFSEYNTMPIPVKKMLLEMSYQMGVDGLLEFKNMLKALVASDWDTAHKEAMDSRWARQTPNRAKKVTSVLKTLQG